MQNYRRIAIVDRSALAHNVYKMILKPLGFSLFHYKTLREFKENLDSKWGCNCFLINSNTFGNHLDRHLEWLKREPFLQRTHKIFLCEASEKKIQSQLKELPRSHLVLRPFYPDFLEKTLNRFSKETS